MAMIPRGYARREITWLDRFKDRYDTPAEIRGLEQKWGGDLIWQGGDGVGGGGSYSAPDINIPGFGGGSGGDGSGGTGTGGSGYELPEYNLPGRDDARIEELRTKALNPVMRGLRNNLQASMIRGRISDNPYAESLRQGELLAGQGRGLENAMGGAQNTAMSQYAPEFAAANQKAGAQFQAGVSRAGQMYAGGLQRGNLQYSTQAQATMQKAQMEHQARLSELNASLRMQYPNI